MKTGNILILLLSASMVLVSCLKNDGYESSYNAAIDFDYFSKDWDISSQDGKFYGDDKAYFESSFQIGDLFFASNYDEALSDFSGFGLSIATKDDDIDGGRYCVNTEKAASGEVYAVFHNNPSVSVDRHIVFTVADYGTCTPSYCMVNNTKYVADRIAEYNSANDDCLEVKLKATGYSGGAETGSAEILLAGRIEQKDSIMYNWTRLDLGTLGSVEYINFDISFSDPAQEIVPQYFCMDNFLASVHVSIPAE